MKTLRAALLATALSAPLVPLVPASAVVVLDCSAGPVIVRGSGETFELSGDCSTVTVKGSNLLISLTSADRIVLRGSHTRLRADDAGDLSVVGASNRITVVRATSLRLRGAANRATLTRVPAVTVRGASNRVVVAKGRTKVKVVGASNVVRTPRRSPAG